MQNCLIRLQDDLNVYNQNVPCGAIASGAEGAPFDNKELAPDQFQSPPQKIVKM